MMDTVLTYINGDVHTTFGVLIKNLWGVFSIINGNPAVHNSGVKLFVMLSFTVFLLAIIQLRVKLAYDVKHVIAFIGALFLLIRIFVMLGFEWGWEIGVYDDGILHYLYPPLEHFWDTLFILSMAYYTLNTFNYYPVALQKAIPYFLLGFGLWFLYSFITWKLQFTQGLPSIGEYYNCMVDWQNHTLISIVSLYTLFVTVYKYKKHHQYIIIFWVAMFLEHLLTVTSVMFGYNTNEMLTMLNALYTIGIGTLVMNFIDIYIYRHEPPKERRMRSPLVAKVELKERLGA